MNPKLRCPSRRKAAGSPGRAAEGGAPDPRYRRPRQPAPGPAAGSLRSLVLPPKQRARWAALRVNTDVALLLRL